MVVLGAQQLGPPFVSECRRSWIARERISSQRGNAQQVITRRTGGESGPSGSHCEMYRVASGL